LGARGTNARLGPRTLPRPLEPAPGARHGQPPDHGRPGTRPPLGPQTFALPLAVEVLIELKPRPTCCRFSPSTYSMTTHRWPGVRNTPRNSTTWGWRLADSSWWLSSSRSTYLVCPGSQPVGAPTGPRAARWGEGGRRRASSGRAAARCAAPVCRPAARPIALRAAPSATRRSAEGSATARARTRRRASAARLYHAPPPRAPLGISLIATCSPVAQSRHSCTLPWLPLPRSRTGSNRFPSSIGTSSCAVSHPMRPHPGAGVGNWWSLFSWAQSCAGFKESTIGIPSTLLVAGS
jgi:hypothetical protein